MVNIARDISTAATNLLHNKQRYLGAEIMYVAMAGFPGHFSYTNRTTGIEPLDKLLQRGPESGKDVCRRGHQKAGTAGFTPHTMILGAGLAVDEIAGVERSFIHLQYSVKQMQFFDAGMRVSGIIGSGIKPDQHAHTVAVRVLRQYLDVDTWRGFLPLWLNRRVERRNEWLRASFAGDSVRQPQP